MPALDSVAAGLQNAAIDPTAWPTVLHELSMAVGGVGAVLISPDKRLPGAPVSPEIVPMLDASFAQGWNVNDVRFRGIDIALRQGVTVDQDFVTPDEMRRLPYYNDWLLPFGCRFFAAVAITCGGRFWCISIQKTVSQGAFEAEEVRRLSTLVKPLNDAAALSHQLSGVRLSGMSDALQLTNQAAVLLDEGGRIITMNALAEAALADRIDIRASTLAFPDHRSRDNMDALLATALSREAVEGPVPGSTVIRDRQGRWRHVRAIALRGWARYSFTNASVMVLIGDPPRATADPETLIRAAFGLTAAEARLAQALRSGRSLAQAAERFGITYETARSQLRNIFLKTSTNRQGQLVAALAHLPEEQG